ncbi:hypothetical protein PNOK_0067900 [Pyrrhoderma noxium]|uniref:Uncharacterized protein n=1 Tax=Pyrrhoderma noxium TaxID=2282107 RepID=A0A286UVM7_9AGAM|nr:hypothetical protein PNOK_0067900 [Pyrrhoderma noxium]
MPRAASPTSSSICLRNSQGVAEEQLYETKAQNTKGSPRGATYADIERGLPEDEKEVIDAYFRLVCSSSFVS